MAISVQNVLLWYSLGLHRKQTIFKINPISISISENTEDVYQQMDIEKQKQNKKISPIFILGT